MLRSLDCTNILLRIVHNTVIISNARKDYGVYKELITVSLFVNMLGSKPVLTTAPCV
jgi:hypothetical protein